MGAGWTRKAALVLPVLVAFLAFPSPGRTDTPKERVKKFESALGEQVVRDSGKPLEGEERRTALLRTLLWISGAVAALVLASVLLSRLKARRRAAEATLRYLTENLMTRAAVRDHLQRIAESRTPISLWLDDHFIRFASRAEEMAGDGGTFAVAPLSPASGNGMLRNARRIRVEYLYQKVPYNFDAAGHGERGEKGSYLHLLSVPDRIQFVQRRDHYRVEPPLSRPVDCTVVGKDVPGLSVLDIGMGGFSVATSSRFRPGEELEVCRIHGGSLLPVEVSARCVYELPLPEASSLHRFRFGFLVTRLADGADKRLAAFISRLQLADLSRRKEMER